jgi:hypothetical protein
MVLRQRMIAFDLAVLLSESRAESLKNVSKGHVFPHTNASKPPAMSTI